MNVRGQSVKAASLSRIEASPRLAAGVECGRGSCGGSAIGSGGGGGVGAGGRPGYGYEALSAASDGSDGEPDDAPEYAAFEMELSAGGESVEGPSSRASTKVNFPPDVELERRPTAAALPSAVYHRGRGRSMSAWSDISRSSIRFEERSVTICFKNLFYAFCMI